MKLHSTEGKFNSSVFVSEEFLTIMRNLLCRVLTVYDFIVYLDYNVKFTVSRLYYISAFFYRFAFVCQIYLYVPFLVIDRNLKEIVTLSPDIPKTIYTFINHSFNTIIRLVGLI